jgi:predicted transcriptional regulator YdeE
MKEAYVMNYEIVYLEEKIVAGITIQTNNSDPNMSKAIGETWQKFFAGGIYQSIPNKQNSNSIGLYTNYENKINGSYDMMVCCEVSNVENLSDGIDIKRIKEGRYAKFIAKGNVQKAVAEFWERLWTMNLDRKYSFDFEEYKGEGNMVNAEINIYISIN